MVQIQNLRNTGFSYTRRRSRLLKSVSRYCLAFVHLMRRSPAFGYGESGGISKPAPPLVIYNVLVAGTRSIIEATRMIVTSSLTSDWATLEVWLHWHLWNLPQPYSYSESESSAFAGPSRWYMVLGRTRGTWRTTGSESRVLQIIRRQVPMVVVYESRLGGMREHRVGDWRDA